MLCLSLCVKKIYREDNYDEEKKTTSNEDDVVVFSLCLYNGE